MSFDFEAEFFRGLLGERGVRPRRLLVIGCGDGSEAGHLARATGALGVGIDLVVEARARGAHVELARADARRLPFRDGAFDAVYCYHVLEHVPEPERAIAEARRVLSPGGLGYWGTPNRSRLAGYVGGRATTWEKVKWNLADWGKRLSGRWSNELGAHAGFSEGELGRLLRASFPSVESVSLPYYLGKYPRLAGVWRAMFQVGLGRFLTPSVYFRTGVDAAQPVQR